MISKVSTAVAVLVMNLKLSDAFLNGVNMPWVNCGNDWGVDYKPDEFQTRM